MFENIAVVAVVGILLVLLLVGLAIVKRYKVAGPNEAFIITGRRGKTSQDLSSQKVVAGGGVFVLPFVQQLQVMDLSSRRISVQIRGAVSKQGIKLNLDGVALVKVGGDESSIRSAAQRFLTQQGEIETFTTEVLAGGLRSIVGTLSVEEIIRDRASFAAQVAEVTESALTNQGLVLDTFQIQDVTDDGTYLADLGRPEAALVKQHAAVAEADATRKAEQARIAAEGQVLEAQRELALKQAAVQAETDAAKADANAAGPLTQAAKEQEILTEQEKVATARAALTDKELDTEVRKPADAARYKIEQEAEGSRTAVIKKAEADKARIIAEAEAKAKQDELTGEGEKLRRSALAEAEAIEGLKQGQAEQAKREAIAQAVKIEGLNKAQAVLAVGQAEAEAMEKKAQAYAKYTQAAVLEMLINKLPEIAKEVSAPMSNIDNLTVISSNGAGELPKQVVDNVTQIQNMLKASTGIDLVEIVSNYAKKPSQVESLANTVEKVKEKTKEELGNNSENSKKIGDTASKDEV
jgi:flotillin